MDRGGQLMKLETCTTCNTPRSLENLLNKYDKHYLEKECVDCKITRFDGCFYEPLLTTNKISPTFHQKKIMGRLIAWCFG